MTTGTSQRRLTWMAGLAVGLALVGLVAWQLLDADTEPVRPLAPGAPPAPGPADPGGPPPPDDRPIVSHAEPAQPAAREPTRAERRLALVRAGERPLALTVLTPAGTAVEGAEVTVFLARGLNLPRAAGRVDAGRTDARGRFVTAAALDAGARYLVRVAHPEHARAWVGPVDPLEPDSLERAVRLRPGQPVVGTVRAAGGSLVSDARVTALDLDAPVSGDAERVERAAAADGEGAFTLPALAAGPKRIVVRAPGFATEERRLSLSGGGDGRTLDVRLPLARSLAGRVVDAETGLGVEGATVRVGYVLGGGRGGARPLAAVETGAGGGFECHELRDGTYIVTADAPGYAPSPRRNAGPDEPDLVLELEPRHEIAGVVFDAAGFPVAGATVVASRRPEAREVNWRSRATTTDGRGAFRVAGAALAPFFVHARAPGLVCGRAGPFDPERDGPPRDVQIVLQPGAVVRGRIAGPGGEPLTGRDVVLYERYHVKNRGVDGGRARPARSPVARVTTFGDGSYVFPAVGSGEYQVSFPGDEQFGARDSAPFPVGGAGAVPMPDLVLERAARIEGTVLDTDGRPADGAVVSVTPETKGAARRSVTTDAGGSFSVGGLVPGSYRLVVVKSRGRTLPGALLASTRGRGTLVRVGAGAVERVRLRAK